MGPFFQAPFRAMLHPSTDRAQTRALHADAVDAIVKRALARAGSDSVGSAESHLKTWDQRATAMRSWSSAWPPAGFVGGEDGELALQ